MAVESSTAKVMLQEQLHRMASAGYSDLLEIPKAEYAVQILSAIERADTETTNGELLSIVEPRIPFNDQLCALELQANPALYYSPQHSTHRPYIARLQLIHPYDQVLGGNTYQEMVANLPKHLRPASPFEGLLIYQDILARGFAAFAGGRYDNVSSLTGDIQTLFQYHCIENFLGKPRMSFIEAQSSDYFVSLAVAKRGHIPSSLI